MGFINPLITGGHHPVVTCRWWAEPMLSCRGSRQPIQWNSRWMSGWWIRIRIPLSLLMGWWDDGMMVCCCLFCWVFHMHRLHGCDISDHLGHLATFPWHKNIKNTPGRPQLTSCEGCLLTCLFWAKWRAMKAIEGYWRLSGYIHQWCVDIVDVSTIDWLIGSDWHVSSFKRVKWRGCFHSISRLLWWDVRRETFPELPGSGSRVTKKVPRAWPFFVWICVDCNHGVTIAPPFHGYFISCFFSRSIHLLDLLDMFNLWLVNAGCTMFGMATQLPPASWPSRKVRCEWQRCQKRSAAACSVGSTRGWPWGHGGTVVRSLLAQITPRKHAPAMAMPGAWVNGKHEKSPRNGENWRM